MRSELPKTRKIEKGQYSAQMSLLLLPAGRDVDVDSQPPISLHSGLTHPETNGKPTPHLPTKIYVVAEEARAVFAR